MTKRGKFIVVEGADGAGTTTVSKHVVEKGGEGFVWTSEPMPRGSNIVSDEIWNILERKSPLLSWHTMCLLFMIDRNFHLEKIEDWLSSGLNVVCDRFYPSTMVYQSIFSKFGSKNTMEQIRRFGLLSHLMLIPDLTLFLSVDDGSVLADRRSNRDKEDVFDACSKMIIKGYREWYHQYEIGDNIGVIYASRELNEVLKQCDIYLSYLFR